MDKKKKSKTLIQFRILMHHPKNKKKFSNVKPHPINEE